VGADEHGRCQASRHDIQSLEGLESKRDIATSSVTLRLVPLDDPSFVEHLQVMSEKVPRYRQSFPQLLDGSISFQEQIDQLETLLITDGSMSPCALGNVHSFKVY
jgi:hypothetical protein